MGAARSDRAADEARVEALGRRHLVLVASLVLSCAALYGSTVLAGHLADGPGAAVLPSETSAALGYLAILLTPFACVAGTALVGGDVLQELRAGAPLRAVRPALVVLALCLSVLTAYLALGPLTSWWLD